MGESVSVQEAGSVVNTFRHLTAELEPFVKVDDLKLCFDRHGNVYLQGDDFQEQIQAKFSVTRELQNELRRILAKHRPRQAL